jgi:predicted nucleic acid-binding protein
MTPAKTGDLLESSPEGIVSDYLALAQLVRPASTPRVVPDDPDDDHVIACALTAHADLIVSGDSALLAIREHAAIRIVSPAEALTLLPRS